MLRLPANPVHPWRGFASLRIRVGHEGEHKKVGGIVKARLSNQEGSTRYIFMLPSPGIRKLNVGSL